MNSNLSQYIQNQVSSSITIPLSLFNDVATNITVYFFVQNALQFQYFNTFSTQIMTEKNLTIVLDTKNGTIIKSSNLNIISASVYDYCGSTCRFNYK